MATSALQSLSYDCFLCYVTTLLLTPTSQRFIELYADYSGTASKTVDTYVAVINHSLQTKSED